MESIEIWGMEMSKLEMWGIVIAIAVFFIMIVVGYFILKPTEEGRKKREENEKKEKAKKECALQMFWGDIIFCGLNSNHDVRCDKNKCPFWRNKE